MKIDDSKNPQWKAWQEHLDHALKHLPEKTAPSNLIPNVMAEILATETRKGFRLLLPFKHSWIRASAAIFAFALMAYISFIGVQLYENDILPAFKLAGSTCRTVLESLAVILSEIPFGVGDEVLQFLLPILICVTVAMYLTCIGVGTFIYRTVRR